MTIPVSILSLARAGATQRAWEAFLAAGLDHSNQPEALTLKGRLLKDRARQAAGAERAALFAQSGAAYAQAATLRPDSYPLVNAAAMALFAGDGASAARIACDVLALVGADPTQGETPYWREATRAEALLLLDRRAEAQASLGAAIGLAPQAWEDHASTLRQFAAILAANGADAGWLDQYRPAPALHFSGILRLSPDDDTAKAAIGDAITAIAPGFGYGALGAGADIVAAEAIVARGGELHVVLPADPEQFAETSVIPFGEGWKLRFDALLEKAASLAICGQMTRAGIALADYRAMGMAAEKAALLETRAVALRAEPEGRPSLGDPWLRSGRELVHVPVTASAKDAPPVPLGEGSLSILLMLAQDLGHAEPMGFASLTEALAALPDGEITAAIDARTDGERGDVAALLQNAVPGTIVASTAAAMALMAEGRCRRIEPLGAMETSDGETGVYAVMLAGKG